MATLLCNGSFWGVLEVDPFLDRDGSSSYASGKIERTSDWGGAATALLPTPAKLPEERRGYKHYSPFGGAQEVML